MQLTLRMISKFTRQVNVFKCKSAKLPSLQRRRGRASRATGWFSVFFVPFRVISWLLLKALSNHIQNRSHKMSEPGGGLTGFRYYVKRGNRKERQVADAKLAKKTSLRVLCVFSLRSLRFISCFTPDRLLLIRRVRHVMLPENSPNLPNPQKPLSPDTTYLRYAGIL